MKLAYVAGPYRAETIYEITQNIQRARNVALQLWGRGYAVICPHSNTSYFDGMCPDSVWLEGSLEMLRRCDFVVLVPNWKDSEGTWAEVNEAKRLGIPVYERDEFLAVHAAEEGRKTR